MPDRATAPTRPALVVDLALARRAEGAMAESARDYAQRQGGSDLSAADIDDGDRDRAAYLMLGGGVAVYGGPNAGPNVGRMWSLGLSGPVEDDELERAEAFYRARGRPAQVMLCPLADAGLLGSLSRRGYRPVRFDAVLGAYPEDVAAATEVQDPGVVVTPIEEEDWPRVWAVARVAYGLESVGEPRALARSRPMFTPPSRMFLVEKAGAPVAVGTIVPTRGGVAHYLGAGVVPEARGGHLQRLLIHVRARYAQAEGQDLLVATCASSGASFTNLTRAGFTPLYTALLLEKNDAVGPE